MSNEKRGSPPPLPAAVRRATARDRRVGGRVRPTRNHSGAIRAVPQPNNPLAVFQQQAKPSLKPPLEQPSQKQRPVLLRDARPELPLVLPSQSQAPAVGADSALDPTPEAAPRVATTADADTDTNTDTNTNTNTNTAADTGAGDAGRISVSSERPTVPYAGTFAFDEAPTLTREPEVTPGAAAAEETDSALPVTSKVAAVAAPPERVEPELTNSSDLDRSSRPKTRRWLSLLIAAAGLAGLLVVGSVLYPELYQRGWRSASAALPGTALEEQARADHGETPARSPKPEASAPAGTSPWPAAPASGDGETTGSDGSDATAIPWSTRSTAAALHCLPGSRDSETRNDELVRAQKLTVVAHRRLIQGDLQGSIEVFCRAAALDRNNSTLAFRLAQALLLERDGVAAEKWAKRALTATPPDHRAHEYLADALAWQGKVEPARAEWFRIRKVTKQSDEMLDTMRRGALLEAKRARKHGDFIQAERFLRRALVFDTESAKTTTLIASVVLQEGHAESAARWIARALELGDDDSQRQLLAGDIQKQLGNAAAASVHFRRALELDPKNAAARLRAKQ